MKRPRLPPDLKALPQRFADRYVPIEQPEPALARAGWWRTRAQRITRHFLSDFDANALWGIYPMQLLGSEGWKQLLGNAPRRTLLDVGAGSGDVTAELAPLFQQVQATETSQGMCRKLRKRGYDCELTDLSDLSDTTQSRGTREASESRRTWHASRPRDTWDVIACLNVLDRCARPRSLLRALIQRLGNHSRLLVALALPCDPFFYVGAETHAPLEPLPCDEPTWEASAVKLLELLEEFGLEIECWTRAGYRSGGDAQTALYELDDVIVVAKRV